MGALKGVGKPGEEHAADEVKAHPPDVRARAAVEAPADGDHGESRHVLAQSREAAPAVTHEKIWASQKEYSIELTKHARQIGFAGFAVAWLFRDPSSGAMSLPVLSALGSLSGFFVLDLLQYLVGAVLLRLWIHGEERKRIDANQPISEGDYSPPKWLDVPAFALWCIKLGLLILGFGFLGFEVLQQVSAAS